MITNWATSQNWKKKKNSLDDPRILFFVISNIGRNSQGISQITRLKPFYNRADLDVITSKFNIIWIKSFKPKTIWFAYCPIIKLALRSPCLWTLVCNPCLIPSLSETRSHLMKLGISSQDLQDFILISLDLKKNMNGGSRCR
jgi:hypothetical protein